VVRGNLTRSARSMSARASAPRGPRSGLGNRRVEFGQAIGGHLRALDGLCDARSSHASKGSAGSAIRRLTRWRKAWRGSGGCR